jgi:hypothetical protein
MESRFAVEAAVALRAIGVREQIHYSDNEPSAVFNGGLGRTADYRMRGTALPEG